MAIDPQTAVARSIFTLAGLCKASEPPLSSQEVLQQLRKITVGAKHPFSEFEKPLIAIQRIYSECIGHLKKFPEKERAWIHAVILSETEFHRHKAFLPIFDLEIEKMQGEIDWRQEEIRDLQGRIGKGLGDKVQQKARRAQLLSECSILGTELNRMKDLRADIAKKVLDASNKAKLARAEMGRKSHQMDMGVFKGFEELIEKREKIKTLFFLTNNWPLLLLDNKVQNAFDAILRATVVTPPSCWQQICCCFKFV